MLRARPFVAASASSRCAARGPATQIRCEQFSPMGLSVIAFRTARDDCFARRTTTASPWPGDRDRGEPATRCRTGATARGPPSTSRGSTCAPSGPRSRPPACGTTAECVALRNRAWPRLRRPGGTNAIVRRAPEHDDRRDSDVAIATTRRLADGGLKGSSEAAMQASGLWRRVQIRASRDEHERPPSVGGYWFRTRDVAALPALPVEVRLQSDGSAGRLVSPTRPSDATG